MLQALEATYGLPTHSLVLTCKGVVNKTIISVQAINTQGTSRIWRGGYCLLNFDSIKLQYNKLGVNAS